MVTARKRLIATALLLGCGFAAGQVNAGVVSAGSGTGSPSGTVAIPLTFTGDGATVDFQGDVTFDTANFTPTITPANGGGCALRAAPNQNQIRVTAPPGQTTALPTGPTTYCNVSFAVGAATPPAVYPLTVGGTLCFDIGGGTPACTGSNGAITIALGPAAPTVTLAPAGGLTLPGGGVGQTVNGNVTGTVAGGNTTGTLGLACTASAGFTVNSGGTQTVAVGGTVTPINVGCTLTAAVQNGTLTCVQTPNPAETPVRPNLTEALVCPQGGATPPTIAYAPPPATPILLTGAVASTATSNIVVSQTAAGQAGSSVTVGPCTAGAGFTVAPATPITFTGGATNPGGTVSVSCTVPPVGTPDATGTLTCPQTTATGVGAPTTINQTWPVTCRAPSPEFNSSPAGGSTINVSGIQGSTATTSVSISNTGLADLTVTCAVAPAGAFTITSAPVTPVAPGASTAVVLSCAVPGVAGAQATGQTLTCTTNDADEGTVAFPLVCTALSASIPTLGGNGKLLLGMLVLALGLGGMTLRRRFQ